MPGLNFDYTQFLKRQNALYLLKYQNDPIEVAENPSPIAGYSGHVPCYRSSIHQQRMVRSLVRCLTSPTKPTTATGFKTATNRLPEVEPTTMIAQETKVTEKKSEVSQIERRVQSAPPVARTEKIRQIGAEPTTPAEEIRNGARSQAAILDEPGDRPAPSRLSMMSAGSSDAIRRDMARPPSVPVSYRSRSRLSNAESPTPPSRPPTRGSSRAHSSTGLSTISERPITRTAVSRYPAGFVQTLYGSSFTYAWPDVRSELQAVFRPESYEKDRRLTRADNIIYHKHEGVVPKYMGYVPGYKFRHGATYGVLTSHATHLGAIHKLK